MSAAHKTNNLIQLKLIKKKRDSNSWALSYGDMVTVLLCFFIIFYALEKQIEKKTIIAAKASITGAVATPHEASGLDTEFKYAIESLEKIEGIEVKKTSEFVDINFKKTIFFNKGKTSLTSDGKAELERVISKLTKIDGKYTLEIQGHADSSQVKKNLKGRWWQSNMELSVLRALDVHSFLAENHIDKDQLIVSGHGAQKGQNKDIENNDEYNRKISLRLQLVK